MRLKEIIDDELERIFSYNKIDVKKKIILEDFSNELINYLVEKGLIISERFSEIYGINELIFQSKVIKNEDDYSVPLYENAIKLLLKEKYTIPEYRILMTAFISSGIDTYIINLEKEK
ncbi:MAG: hypothetical protein KatS3mg002_0588 [Candidatus Woesearchaeota archaeon]|nr:MAG: hypothetical protein KatS3mg002_0588 [Candidatus Woesearchaeota archaeon]